MYIYRRLWGEPSIYVESNARRTKKSENESGVLMRTLWQLVIVKEEKKKEKTKQNKTHQRLVIRDGYYSKRN